MSSISKSVYIDKLDDIFNKYDNTYHRTIKMKPVDVKSNTYINSSKEINDKDPKFKIGDTVRISKYKNIFTKGHVLNWPEEVFVLKKFEQTMPWTYFIADFNGEDIVGTFYKRELGKVEQKEFRTDKSNKRKDNELHVKWKGYDKSFNRWVGKKNLV